MFIETSKINKMKNMIMIRIIINHKKINYIRIIEINIKIKIKILNKAIKNIIKIKILNKAIKNIKVIINNKIITCINKITKNNKINYKVIIKWHLINMILIKVIKVSWWHKFNSIQSNNNIILTYWSRSITISKTSTNWPTWMRIWIIILVISIMQKIIKSKKII